MASTELTAQIKDAVLSALEWDGSLKERLAEIANQARIHHPEFAAAIDRLVARLRDAGAASIAPKPGEPMPPFVLPDDSGRLYSLEEMLNQEDSIRPGEDPLKFGIPAADIHNGQSAQPRRMSEKPASSSPLLVR